MRGHRYAVAARVAVAAVLALAGAVLLATPAARAASGWQWPTDPANVLRGFEAPDGPYGPGHRGVDLEVARDQVVTAPQDGTVTFVGMIAGTPVVVVGHGELRSTFQPVRSTLPRGAVVRRGEVIGTTADGFPHCDRSCVHWGVLRGDEYLDPAALIAPRPARLLPYWSSDRSSDWRSDAGAGDRRSSHPAADPADVPPGSAPRTAPDTTPGTTSSAAPGSTPGALSAPDAGHRPARRLPGIVGIAVALAGAGCWAVAARWHRRL
jgi:murein DD-endopeptidase MepM/ murein hydrolase activator NlpD